MINVARTPCVSQFMQCYLSISLPKIIRSQKNIVKLCHGLVRDGPWTVVRFLEFILKFNGTPKYVYFLPPNGHTIIEDVSLGRLGSVWGNGVYICIIKEKWNPQSL